MMTQMMLIGTMVMTVEWVLALRDMVAVVAGMMVVGGMGGCIKQKVHVAA